MLPFSLRPPSILVAILGRCTPFYRTSSDECGNIAAERWPTWPDCVPALCCGMPAQEHPFSAAGPLASSWMNQRLKHCPCRHGLFDLTYFDIQWGIETTLCTVVEAGGIALSTYSS